MTSEKARENRLRRMAARQGLFVEKSRRRDPLAADYGTYTLVDEASAVVAGPGLTAQQLELVLQAGAAR